MFRVFTTYTRLEVDRSAVIYNGTYGPVYRGNLGSFDVAVKVVEIKRSTVNNNQEKALLRLEHPNIVRLIHVDQQGEYR